MIKLLAHHSTMKLLICLLPVVIHARITIDINASQSMTESDIAIKGSTYHTITNQDQSNFKLDETTLTNGVLLLSGKLPTNVYIKSPTPWNDLYKTNHWKEVTTILRPKRIRVVNIKKETAILNKKEVVNSGTEKAVKQVSMTAKVENKVTSIWEKYAKKFEADIDYNINFKGVGNVTSFNLNSSWGVELEADKVGVDSVTTVQVPLKPNENATVIQYATKVTVEIGVRFEAMLDGMVVANYENKYNDHHFWAFDVASVLNGVNNFASTVETKEFIYLEFYEDLGTKVHGH